MTLTLNYSVHFLQKQENKEEIPGTGKGKVSLRERRHESVRFIRSKLREY